MTTRSVKIQIEAEDQASPLVEKSADRMSRALESTANRIKQSVLTPTQRYQQELRELRTVLKAGKITQHEYNLALDQTRGKYSRLSNTVKTHTAKMQSTLGFFSSMRFGIIGVGAAAGAFILPIKRSIDAVDKLAKTSSKLGFDPAQLQMARFAGEQTGVDTGTMDMALQRYTRRTAEAAQGTGEAKGALAELNLEASALMRMPLQDQMMALADAFARVPEEADRVRLAMKLFDSEGVSLVNTLQGGSAALDELFKQRESMGGLFSAGDAARAEEAADAWNSAATKIKSSFTEMVVNIAPQLTAAAEMVAKAARGASGNAEGGFGIQKAVYDATLRNESESTTRAEKRGRTDVDPEADAQTRLTQLRKQEEELKQKVQDIRGDSMMFRRMFKAEREAWVQSDIDENRQGQLRAHRELGTMAVVEDNDRLMTVSQARDELATRRQGIDDLKAKGERKTLFGGRAGLDVREREALKHRAEEHNRLLAKIRAAEQADARRSAAKEAEQAEAQMQANRSAPVRAPMVPGAASQALDSAVSLLGGIRLGGAVAAGAGRLAGALPDDLEDRARGAAERAEARVRGVTDSRREAERITAETRTPAERLASERARLTDLKNGGFLDGETFARAMEKAGERFGPRDDRDRRKGETPGLAAVESRFLSGGRKVDPQVQVEKNTAETNKILARKERREEENARRLERIATRLEERAATLETVGA